MRKTRSETANHRHWERWIYLSLVILLGGLAGCGVQNPEGTGGHGGQAGQGGAALIQEPSAEESLVVHDPRWDLPGGLEEALVPVSNATACTSGTQCPTGYCVDGFCCDSKCDNKCMACSAAKKGSGVDGICGSIKYDTDPDNDCPYGACDGKNMCKNYNGFSCTAAPQCLSNYCVDGFCCNNICMGSCQACSAAKKGSGQDGLCGSIKAATDPDNECSNGDCNGSGACTTSPQPTSPNGTACTSAAQCASGYCADGVCCDSWCLGSCQACTAAKKNQGVDGTCGNIANDKDPDEECWGGACNGAGVCKQYNGVPCVDKTQCLSNYCVDGFCCGNICTGWCYACSEARKGGGYDGACGPILSGRDPDSECTPGECNGSGTCNQAQTPLVNGSACIAAGQCASGNCIDGYCCDTTCTSLCQACSATKKGSGANGTCGNIISETDPDSECGYGGRCGGNGTCKYYNGIPCTSTAQCFSNYCADGVCCGNICNQTCNACSAAKKGQGSDGACGPIANTRDPDNECNPGECNGSGACNQSQTPQANGATCALTTQCVSGNCVDGVCCDTACTGSCQACSATKKGQGTSGACGPIKYDTDPDEECYGGACSGSGTCKSYNGLSCTAATLCLSSYCVDGVCCGNQCSGTCYACTAAKKGSGYDGVCGVIANNADPDNECGLTCNGSGACVKAPIGSACTSAADCIAGFCADGFCCNTACTGTCYACDVSGAHGACTNVCSPQCSGATGFPNAPFSPLMTQILNRAYMSAVADFNHDGNQDIVVASGSEQVKALLGRGNGTFDTPIQLSADDTFTGVATGDLDGDTFADIVVARHSVSNVDVYRNQGNWTFAAPVNYEIGSFASSVSLGSMLQIADVNGDGIADIATINRTDGTVTVLVGQGNATFPTRLTIPAPEQPIGLTIGRFNADTVPDLAVITYDTATSKYRISVLMGQGGGAFGTAVNYVIDASVASLTAGDINGDGRLDLVATGAESSMSSKLFLLLNQGNGTFANAVSYEIMYAGQVITTRLNGDALADVVVGTYYKRTVEVFMGQANGTLAPRLDYSPGATGDSVAAADFDNDNDNDLVVGGTDYLGSYLSVMKNSGTGSVGQPLNTAPTLPWDIYDMVQSDINGDGNPDLFGMKFAPTLDTKVLLGNGNGTFAAPVVQQVEGNVGVVRAFGLRDISGDGKPDLVYCIKSPKKCVVRFGQGNGTFGSSTYYDVVSTYSNNNEFGEVTFGDFDGNGTLDMATVITDSLPLGLSETDFGERVYVMVWPNNGAGVFGPRTDTLVHDAIGHGVMVSCPIHAGDFNGDGKADFVMALGIRWTKIFFNSGGGQFTTGTSLTTTLRFSTADLNNDNRLDIYGWKYVGSNYDFTVWLNNGTGTFTEAYASPLPTNGNNTTLADLNGDGVLDVAYAAEASLVGVKLGQGNGTFGNAMNYTAGFDPEVITTGDWNGDGRVDLAVYNTESTVSLLMNACLP